MTDKLGPRAWMSALPTAAVFDALEAEGGADCARFVGGCVRDALLGRAVGDMDIATRLTPDRVVAALKRARIRAIPTGLDHGTVTAVSRGQPHEITTLRRDVATDGRRATVAFTEDWAQDAGRRDFTLNTLYAGRDGTLHDPTGRGVADALDGRIVFVGEPARRLEEDYLRILRFFRFLAWFGRETPGPEAVAACAAARDRIDTLPAERISRELLKLLAAEDPRAALRLMAETGVLEVVLKIPFDLARLEALVEVEAALHEAADPLLRLAALAPPDPEAGRALAARLRLSNAERDRLAAALDPDPGLADETDMRAVRRAAYRLGRTAFRDRARLAWAMGGGDGWRAAIGAADAWTPPVFPLTGQDVMAAGTPRGPRVGAVLATVEAWWVEADFPDDRAQALARMATAAREAGS